MVLLKAVSTKTACQPLQDLPDMLLPMFPVNVATVSDLSRVAVDAGDERMAELARFAALVQGLDNNGLAACVAACQEDNDLPRLDAEGIAKGSSGKSGIASDKKKMAG